MRKDDDRMTLVTKDNSSEQRSSTKNLNLFSVVHQYLISSLVANSDDAQLIRSVQKHDTMILAVHGTAPQLASILFTLLRSPTSAAVHGSATDRDEVSFTSWKMKDSSSLAQQHNYDQVMNKKTRPMGVDDTSGLGSQQGSRQQDMKTEEAYGC